ncbi:BURP domain-containing protein 3, partial [Ananas comosus]
FPNPYINPSLRSPLNSLQVYRASNMGRWLPLLSLLLVAAAATAHATSPAQVYWRSILPNTPMPSAISNLLSSQTAAEEKAASWASVGKGVGVHVDPGKRKPTTSVHVGPRWAGVSVGPFATGNIRYDASDTELREDPSVAPNFFREKDLRPGKRMTLHFPELTFAPAFLPRKEADSIPFSVEKIPEVLSRFAIQPDSIEAQWMRKTARDCEAPAMKGEKKLCATSLESMVDFSTSSLGTRDVRAVSTTFAKKGAMKQEYTIVSSGIRKLARSDGVVCHMDVYAYAVFYCHLVESTRVYMVKMVGKDGAAVDAAAVCHVDTAAWNPKHLAFQVLKVKPGTVPVCHFLLQDHVVWTRRT